MSGEWIDLEFLLAKNRIRLLGDEKTLVLAMARKLMQRKRHPLSEENAVLAALERVATTKRRLSHETGATGWT